VFVVRQISGVWVTLTIDVIKGITPAVDANDTPIPLTFLYTSLGCTGTAYLAANQGRLAQTVLPVIGAVFTLPPSTQPSIYFAGSPSSLLTFNSFQDVGGACTSWPGNAVFAGPAQSVPVSSLDLTLPFSVK
jgi:hypothetical protein